MDRTESLAGMQPGFSSTASLRLSRLQSHSTHVGPVHVPGSPRLFLLRPCMRLSAGSTTPHTSLAASLCAWLPAGSRSPLRASRVNAFTQHSPQQCNPALTGPSCCTLVPCAHCTPARKRQCPDWSCITLHGTSALLQSLQLCSAVPHSLTMGSASLCARQPHNRSSLTSPISPSTS